MKETVLEKLFSPYGGKGALRKAIAAWALLLLTALTARAEPMRIYALGDSLTQGYGLLEQDGLVPQLQRWMDENGHEITVVNGGVSGDTTAGGAARVEWSLTPDIKGLMVALGGNDLLRGLPPEEAKANLATILVAADAAGVPVLLVGMEAPANYGADYKRAFDAIYPELSKAYDTLYEPSLLGALGETPEEALALMQDDGIHPNEAGVARIAEALGPRIVELAERAAQTD